MSLSPFNGAAATDRKIEMTDTSTLLGAMATARIVPVLRLADPALARKACDALVEAGMTALEITFSIPDAGRLIADLRAAHPSALIGAGTVLTATQADEAAAAGAAFAVAPGAAPEAAERCRRHGVPFIPGAATPSEILARRAEGAPAVKVFPAKQLGGPAFLKAMKSVYPDIPIMPTGGVAPDNAADYLSAGAFAVGMGGELLPKDALASGDFEAIRRGARTILERCGAAA